jgi:hypothetical protein
MLDQMAERYGKLPSEVIQNASTVDLFVYDTGVSYRNLLERRSRGEKDEIPQEVLLEKWEKYNAKGKSNK